MAAAGVYQGQLKFEVLREAFRKERLSAGATSAAERVTSARGWSVTAHEDREAPKGCKIQAASATSGQNGCTMGEFFASFGVVRQDGDVSSSSADQNDLGGDVSCGGGQTAEVGGDAVVWVCRGATAKRKRVRGTLFRQLSEEETAAWLQSRAEAETESQHGTDLEGGTGLCVSGSDYERHVEGPLDSCLDKVIENQSVPMPPLLEDFLEGADCRQETGEDKVKSEPEEISLAWELEEIRDAELTLGQENLFEEMEAVGGRGYDRPLLMRGLRDARIPKKDRHVEGIPVARRKRKEKHEWWY